MLAPIALVFVIFLGGILIPPLGGRATAPLATLALAIAGVAILGPRWLARLDRAVRARARVVNVVTLVMAVVVTLGGLEYTARLATGLGLVGYYQAMRTLVPAGTEDWRLAHITADRHREPDPLLLWRPVAHAPYNAQHMKGPLAINPKPAGVVRIMCYGDSNTDGPDRGGWPERLQDLLRGRFGPTVEVINAGVTGYSSYQGLLRFRQQVDTFDPDIVLVSFGWNDAASRKGPPDSAFQPPSPARIALERLLTHYRAYRVGRYWLQQQGAAPAENAAHRVPLADYLTNLRGFVRTAREHGAHVVLLTRPHRMGVPALRALADWRAEVPRYNRALLRLARRRGVLAVDVQGAFAGRGPERFADQCHFEPRGHADMARLIAGALIGAGWLPSSPTTPHTSQKAPPTNGR